MSKTNGNSPEQDALLQHQAAIDAAKQQLETLQGIVSQQEDTLGKLVGELPEIASLEQRHEDILAEIAIGNAKAADVEALEKDIAAAKAKRAEINPAVEVCQKTMYGVQRKVQDKMAELDELKKSMPRFIRTYLLAEAERVAQSYLQHAAALIADFKRIEGIAAVLQQHGHVPHLRPHGADIMLPAYALQAFEGKTLFHRAGLIFNLAGYGEILPWAAAETDRIKALGIDFE